MRHLVVSPAQLETEHRKQILPLEKYAAFQAIAEVNGMVEWCFVDDVVDSRCQNQSEILDSSRNRISDLVVWRQITAQTGSISRLDIH